MLSCCRQRGEGWGGSYLVNYKSTFKMDWYRDYKWPVEPMASRPPGRAFKDFSRSQFSSLTHLSLCTVYLYIYISIHTTLTPCQVYHGITYTIRYTEFSNALLIAIHLKLKVKEAEGNYRDQSNRCFGRTVKLFLFNIIGHSFVYPRGPGGAREAWLDNREAINWRNLAAPLSINTRPRGPR